MLALLAFWVWAPAIHRGGFAYDDREAIFGNPVVAGDLPLTSAFDRDYWHHRGGAGHWRPTATLSLRFDRWLFGADARGYHATNCVLHALVVGLAAALAARLARALAAPVPTFGLCLCAVHPLSADCVAWISGRTSLVSALGGLAGLLCLASAKGSAPFARGVLGGALAVGLALLGKEDGLAFAVVAPLAAAALAQGGPRARSTAALGAALGAAAAIAAWLALRFAALGVALPAAPHALLADVALPTRLALAAAAWGEGLAAALAPGWPLPPNLTPADVGGAGLAPRLALAGGLALLGAFVARRCVRRAPRGALLFAAGSALAVSAAVLPHTQLIPSGELFAPRFLYLPLLLGAPLVSALAASLWRSARVRAVLAVAALLWCSGAAQVHAARYASRGAYWRAHLPRHADDPRVWNELGHAAREAGDRAGARAAFTQATELAPGYSRAWVGLGALAAADGDWAQAEAHFARAVAVGADNAVAHANLGNTLVRRGAAAEAVALYRRAVALVPGRAEFHRGHARALAAAGDAEGARAAAATAVALDPGDRSAAALLRELGGG